MGQTVSGTFIMDNGIAANIDIGFIPDYIKLISNLEEGDNEVIFEWWRCLADKEGYGRYGISIDKDGDVTIPTTPATGIIPYTGNKRPRVRIPAPRGVGFESALVYGDYSASVDYASVGSARTHTALGTIVRPTVHNGYVYELITTASGTDTEPTWPTTPGETIDAGYHVWICRTEDVVGEAGEGFTVGATMNIDSDQCVFTAEKHDKYGDLGDAAAGDPISFP